MNLTEWREFLLENISVNRREVTIVKIDISVDKTQKYYFLETKIIK